MSARRLRRHRGLHVEGGFHRSDTSQDMGSVSVPPVSRRNRRGFGDFGQNKFNGNGNGNGNGFGFGNANGNANGNGNGNGNGSGSNTNGRGKTRLSSDDSSGGSGNGGSNGIQSGNSTPGSANSNNSSSSSSNKPPSNNNNSQGNNNSGNSNDQGSSKSPGSNNSQPSLSAENPPNVSTVDPPSSTTSSADSQATNKSPPCFTCIADNDARVRYSGPWTLNSDGFSTTHSTASSGSSLSLVFNGTGIVVFGTVPQSNGTHPPPAASYTIDTDPPFTTTEPLAVQPIPLQPLFKVSSLSSQAHTLIINVTRASTPFTVDSFFVVPGGSAAGLADPKTTSVSGSSSSGTPTSAAPSAPSTDRPSPPSPAQKTTQLVAGLLSGLILFILLIITVIIVRRRRRRFQPITPGMPWFSKYTHSNFIRAHSPEPTIFTSTESIIQNMPSSLWSSHTRSEQQSIADFSIRYPQTPPPLPPKPRSRLSLPTLGNDLRRST